MSIEIISRTLINFEHKYCICELKRRKSECEDDQEFEIAFIYYDDQHNFIDSYSFELEYKVLCTLKNLIVDIKYE